MSVLTNPPPEYNMTGLDLADRRHLRYAGPPLVDFHAHVTRTRPTDPKDGPAGRGDEGATLDQAGRMLEVAAEFNIGTIVTMCPPEDIAPLRQRFGDRLRFNGPIHKKPAEPDEVAYRLLDQYLEAGVSLLKFWSAPRGRSQGLFVDAPWRVEAARRARQAGVRAVMVHVGDPDAWFRKQYVDVAKFGTKPDQYVPLRRMLEEFPDLNWIGAHMGGDPEHPDHLEALLERYPHLSFDTSATKWQVREVSAHREAIRSLVSRHPGRFLFGADLVTRHHLERDHYVSRYWCQRTLWESSWEGVSPIADGDYAPGPGASATPLLRGLGLPQDVLEQIYQGNALKLLQATGCR